MYFCTFLFQNKVQCIYVLQALAPKPSKRWIAVEEIHEANVDPTRVYLKRLGRRSCYAVQLWSRSWIRRFLLKKMSTVFCRLSDYEPFRKPESKCNFGKAASGSACFLPLKSTFYDSSSCEVIWWVKKKNCQKLIYSRTRKELYAILQSNVISTKSNYVGTKEGLFHETYQYLGVVFYSEKLRHHGLKFEQQQRMQFLMLVETENNCISQTIIIIFQPHHS